VLLPSSVHMTSFVALKGGEGGGGGGGEGEGEGEGGGGGGGSNRLMIQDMFSVSLCSAYLGCVV